jgi:hypothetical protein
VLELRKQLRSLAAFNEMARATSHLGLGRYRACDAQALLLTSGQ